MGNSSLSLCYLLLLSSYVFVDFSFSSAFFFVSLVLLMALKPEKAANLYSLSPHGLIEQRQHIEHKCVFLVTQLLSKTIDLVSQMKTKGNFSKDIAPLQKYIHKNVLILLPLIYLFEP